MKKTSKRPIFWQCILFAFMAVSNIAIAQSKQPNVLVIWGDYSFDMSNVVQDFLSKQVQ